VLEIEACAAPARELRLFAIDVVGRLRRAHWRLTSEVNRPAAAEVREIEGPYRRVRLNTWLGHTAREQETDATLFLGKGRSIFHAPPYPFGKRSRIVDRRSVNQ
jgi:hypothetical protein